MRSSAWLTPLSDHPRAQLHLVCCPHAGGMPHFFRDWADQLPDAIALWAVQYPGRGTRQQSDFPDTLLSMADHVARACHPLSHRPIALLGHSMGAALAYEVTVRLEAQGMAPMHLFVSGHPAPHCQRSGSLHRADEQTLLDDVRQQSEEMGTVLGDPALRALFMPALREDYRLIEQYHRDVPVRLDCPITVLRGDVDDEVNEVEAAAWQSASACPLDEYVFSGGHFYLVAQQVPLLAAIKHQLADVLTPTWHDWA
ncbi:hypothetical protein BFW38_17205 [Terasakiispira papahanaumokuakeensis]|uniref:Thioesterase TesA-like domain-containing protein n=2 Tax=Terasakiispira papahanaumokuakeensis TaxID=197479 RepID=A0A1E2VEZ0_9GAMM|nr:hypothetical protein BFW38_17205 [Terasakiispira papahanaumokuakeensis]